jgi:hypothetical protein
MQGASVVRAKSVTISGSFMLILGDLLEYGHCLRQSFEYR